MPLVSSFNLEICSSGEMELWKDSAPFYSIFDVAVVTTRLSRIYSHLSLFLQNLDFVQEATCSAKNRLLPIASPVGKGCHVTWF